jgi:hypothetical protein
MFEHSHDMNVESGLGEIVLDGGNGRFVLHFQICLICVQNNLLSYSGNLPQHMGNIQDSGASHHLCTECVCYL